MYSITTLIGNVGGDPEVKKIQSGMAVAKLSLATSKRVKQQDGEYKEVTQWHNLIFWDKKAEIVDKYVKKGSKIFVTGEIEYRNYENKDGQKVYVTEIVVNELKMLDGKKDSDKNDYPSNEPKAGAKQETKTDDVFENYNAGAKVTEKLRYSLGEQFTVTAGKSTGKTLKIGLIDESSVSFSFNNEIDMHTLNKAAFEKYFDDNIEALPF